MVDAAIISKIKKYIQLLQDSNLPISAVFLFGSQIKSNSGPESDIDLLIVSPKFDENRLACAGVLWKAAWEIDTRIEPIPVGEKAFLTDSITPIYQIVRNEGVKIL